MLGDLPEQGSWPGETHAPLGVLEESEDGVTCHACGWVGHGLYGHIGRAHDLDAATYRAYFGLRWEHPLASEHDRARRRAVYAQRERIGPPNPGVESLIEWNRGATTETRSLVVWKRERRAEAQRTGRHDPEYQAWAASHIDHDDPEYRAAVRKGRRTYDPGRKCVECGVRYCTWTSRHSRASSPRKTCGEPACIRAARSRAARAANRKRREPK